MILFFFVFNISKASSEYDGAMQISKNKLFISFAVAASISRFVISIPPKADTGSPASASLYASTSESREASPQALLCFRMAKVVSLNSSMR